MSGTETAVYRLFDSTETLLYVGIAKNPEKRWRQHARSKSWWAQVAKQTVEWHPTRLAAMEAEATAIWNESPRHNVAKPDPDKPMSDWLEKQAEGARHAGIARVAIERHRRLAPVARRRAAAAAAARMPSAAQHSSASEGSEEDRRPGMADTAMNQHGYWVEVTREGEDWLADVPALPGAHTFARNLESLDRYVREVIVLAEDLPDDAAGSLDLDWRFRTGDSDLDKALTVLRRDRQRLGEERRHVEEATAVLAGLLGRAGFSVRDVAALTGVSRARAQQLTGCRLHQAATGKSRTVARLPRTRV